MASTFTSSSSEAPAGVASAPPRSAAVTYLAWGIIIVSALATPISMISLLMLLAGSHGTQSADLLGIFKVVVAPPSALVAGFGMLRRKRWAYLYSIVLLVILLASAAYDSFRAASAPRRYVSPEGVPTTVVSDGSSAAPFIAVGLGLLAILLSRRVRMEFAPSSTATDATGATTSSGASPGVRASHDARSWRVGHVGRDRMCYEEWRDGAWQRLEIDGEMLTGRAHHAVYLASPERWGSYPEWARDRRDEIVARIKSELREPDYEYGGVGGAASPTRAPAAPAAATSKRSSAPLIAVALLLGLAAGMAWLVYQGVATGETVLPAKYARRSVSRLQEPVMFWTCMSVYATAGLGALGLVAWGAATVRGRSSSGRTSSGSVQPTGRI